ncbi:MAG TPA: hypothetical protein PK052_06265 [Anaerohalosphaeraceae bacterium]|nr:hypothetical protein [Phycisphaerae bacterium]HOK94983.1 hypothetical protein [Anaerohalosphaeraceae bacterium]HOL31572.1 hypothetical protein [Anaerohalosphaeraceae bacterium]HOM76992.1 hypothetical protein [Anaerohalosphaeraceae bacterium]HPC63760.1 hypothetical protein [Anaerohalosphaeraceae bacterium]
MLIFAKMNVLAVGIEQQAEALQGLPIRLLNLTHGSEAIHSFRNDPIDSVISHWNLVDMPDGQFLRSLRRIRPDMPTIAVIQPNNPQQEIEARMLGVSAVVCEDSDSGYFRTVLTNVLGLQSAEAIETLYAVREA